MISIRHFYLKPKGVVGGIIMEEDLANQSSLVDLERETVMVTQVARMGTVVVRKFSVWQQHL